MLLLASTAADQYGSSVHRINQQVGGLPSTGLDVWPLIGLGVLFILIGVGFLALFFRGVRS